MSDHWSGERPRYGKTIKVEDGLKAKSKRGDIGATWWSRRFIEVLESFGMGGRLNALLDRPANVDVPAVAPPPACEEPAGTPPGRPTARRMPSSSSSRL